jgi:hypothetical protein
VIVLRRPDGQQWTWRWALPRWSVTLVGAVVIFRFGFGLSWPATFTFVGIVILGAAVYWRAFKWKLPPNSRRARFLTRIGKRKLVAVCGRCGWRGEIAALTRSEDGGGTALLCPVCGRQVGHSVTNASTPRREAL